MKNNLIDPALTAGKNLKRLILESKWKTQAEFAFEFGADTRTINRWVNNGISSVYTIWALANLLNVDALTFFISTEED